MRMPGKGHLAVAAVEMSRENVTWAISVWESAELLSISAGL
jgi:hypothetical protein